jgi:hypothetical protein
VHRTKIREMGEVEYSRVLWNEFQQWVSRHPQKYLDKVGQRAFSASIGFEQDGGWGSIGFWDVYPRFALSLPWLSISIALQIGVFHRARVPRIYWVGVGLMLVYLAPYVAFAYYDRYGAPLVVIKMTMLAMLLSLIKHSSNHEAFACT